MLKYIIGKKHKYAKIDRTGYFRKWNLLSKIAMFVNKYFDLRINLWYVCYLLSRLIACFVQNVSYVMLCLYVAYYYVKGCNLDIYLCKYLILYWSIYCTCM